MIELDLNLEIQSPNQAANHWGKRHTMNIRNRNLLAKLWLTIQPKPQLPCIVVIKRLFCSKQKQYDFVNFVAACKGIQDIIADLLIPGLKPGRADSSPDIIWDFQQERSHKSTFIIKIMGTTNENY